MATGHPSVTHQTGTIPSSPRLQPLPAPCLCLELSYDPPYDWSSLLGGLRAHQLPDLEAVDSESYERVIPISRGMGRFRVTHPAGKSSLLLEVWNGNAEDVASIAHSVRRIFDLDADPAAIARTMRADPHLALIWSQYPGLRVSRSGNGFESMVTTILGQLVSVSFGGSLMHELMKAAGAKTRHPKTGESIHLFPTAEQILAANLAAVRTSEARRRAIRSVAALAVTGQLRWDQPVAHADLRKLLLSIPGIGAWTAEYVAMRGFGDDDAFPATDYGLKQELKRHPEMKVNRARPWRAYAAVALWNSFAASRGAFRESVL